MQSANPLHTICFVELTIDGGNAAIGENYFLSEEKEKQFNLSVSCKK